MSWKTSTIVTVSAVLGAVAYEVSKRTVSGETLDLLTDFVYLLMIAVFTISCVIWLHKKAWGRALIFAALAGIFAFLLAIQLSHS